MPDHMTITPEQAGAALLSIEDASRHSAILLRYRRAAPFFILWGCCWALAYGLCNFYPNHMGVIWSVSDVIGILGSWRIMRARPITARHHGAWRLMAAVAVVAAFVAASFSVLRATGGHVYHPGFCRSLCAVWHLGRLAAGSDWGPGGMYCTGCVFLG